jgi:transcriptional regulator with XRE-family HTH domain
MADDPWRSQVEALGQFIHAQRKLARLSLRELAELSDLSNAYLSQLERGLHEPSIRVLTSIARALNLSADTMLHQAGVIARDTPREASAPGSAEEAIRADTSLSEEQRRALLAVYRSFRPETGGPEA